jgi:phosphoserine aminotransferase
MSSNFCSREINWDHHAVVYAGTQKNVGPAGACITIIREDLIGPLKRPDTPAICDWETFLHAPAKLHNTPATWSVYVSGLNLAHMIKEGGVRHYDELAKKRSKMLYEYMDSSNGFYVNNVDHRYRSRMNVPFRVMHNE